MEELGLNPYSAAKNSGLQEDTVRDIIRGKVKDPGASKLLRLAKTLGTSVESLLGDEDPSPSLAIDEIQLPVLYKTAAGPWLEQEQIAQTEPKMATAIRIKGYEKFPQWLEQVEGESVNRLIPHGTLIHVVDAIAMGYTPSNDDIVVVLRTRAGGMLQERTVKQVEITTTGIQLWPRSYDPQYSKPLELRHGASEDEEITVEIVGKVVRAYIVNFGRD